MGQCFSCVFVCFYFVVFSYSYLSRFLNFYVVNVFLDCFYDFVYSLVVLCFLLFNGLCVGYVSV